MAEAERERVALAILQAENDHSEQCLRVVYDDGPTHFARGDCRRENHIADSVLALLATTQAAPAPPAEVEAALAIKTAISDWLDEWGVLAEFHAEDEVMCALLATVTALVRQERERCARVARDHAAETGDSAGDLVADKILQEPVRAALARPARARGWRDGPLPCVDR